MLRWDPRSGKRARQDFEINVQLLEHQAQSDWKFAPASQELQLWIERFSYALGLKVHSPALCFLKLRRACGHYCLIRNAFGLNHEIAIDIRHLVRGLESEEHWADVLRTLAHELIHFWEHVHCGRSKGGRYHTVVFRKKAEKCGLLVDQHGHSLGIVPDSPFTRLLDEYGVVVPEIHFDVKSVPATAPTKLKKWACGCTTARIAVADVQWHCKRCGQDVTLRDTGGQ